MAVDTFGAPPREHRHLAPLAPSTVVFRLRPESPSLDVPHARRLTARSALQPTPTRAHQPLAHHPARNRTPATMPSAPNAFNEPPPPGPALASLKKILFLSLTQSFCILKDKEWDAIKLPWLEKHSLFSDKDLRVACRSVPLPLLLLLPSTSTTT